MSQSAGLRKAWRISCLVPDLPSTEAILPYLREIDKNRWYSNFGPLLREFEAGLSGFLAEKYSHHLRVVSLSSATAALELGLQAMQLKKGARILLPSLTFPATILAVLRCGYTPLLADVDAETWALQADYAARAAELTAIDAVLPVASFGYPLPIAAWEVFQKATNIPVLIDAAGALGVQEISTEVPVIFSLHATKPLGIGEGGILVTGDERLADAVRQLSNFGFVDGEITRQGTNAKLSEFHAAVGLVQLARAETILLRRNEILENYRALLPPALFNSANYGSTAPAVLPLHLDGRGEDLVAGMTRQLIETRRWYCPPLHQHKMFSKIERCTPSSDNSLKNSDFLATSLVGIPFHTHLSKEDISTVAQAIQAAL